MRGKDKCTQLKELRKKIADKNGVPYEVEECSFQGDCRGTCPKCEQELKQLTRQIREKNLRKGIIGVGAGMMALGLTGCVDKLPDSDIQGMMQPPVEESTAETTCSIDEMVPISKEDDGNSVLSGDVQVAEPVEEETKEDSIFDNPQIAGGLSLREDDD